jgi:hypothetical protein
MVVQVLVVAVVASEYLVMVIGAARLSQVQSLNLTVAALE